MHYFVTGATGFIGHAVAAALSARGHDVRGLTRSAGKAALLERIEVTPVAGSLGEPSSWVDAAAACAVVVHCAADASATAFDLDRKAVDALLSAATDARLPRLFVYTSGVWIYGSTRGVVDESSPVNPLPKVAARAAIEDRVLSESTRSVRTLVIRPGCVFGGRGSLTAAWFSSATSEGAARIVGDGANRWAMVHLRDLANLYVAAVESSLGGEVINAVGRSRFTVRECAEAASRAAGAGGKVVVTPLDEARAALGTFADCLAVDQHVDASKAERLLGWSPRHPDFVDGVGRYHSAWRSAVAS